MKKISDNVHMITSPEEVIQMHILKISRIVKNPNDGVLLDLKSFSGPKMTESIKFFNQHKDAGIFVIGLRRWREIPIVMCIGEEELKNFKREPQIAIVK